MRPLTGFNGKWNPSMQAIQFQWDPTCLGNDRFIHIVSVLGEGNNLRIDPQHYKFFDIREPKNASIAGTNMKITNARAGVFKMRFCAFSTPNSGAQNDAEVLSACVNDPAYLTTVMIGRAAIVCTIGSSVQDNAKVITFEINSNCNISNGVLGYQYPCDNMMITHAFPGFIQKGKNVFAPILIPRYCDIQVVPYDKQFAGNLDITQKNKLFGF